MENNTINKANILIVDDSPIYRKGVVDFLKLPPLSTYCDEAKNGKKAIEALESKHYHIILLDRRMPVMNGLETARVVRHRFPETGIIVLTGIGLEDKSEIFEFLEIGISGYLRKEDEGSELIKAINAVLKGKQYFTMDVRLLWERYHNDRNKLISNNYQTDNFHDEELSRREKEIICMICNQYTTIEIADRLCISEATVKTHRSHIMNKLKADNVLGIAMYAVKSGLFKP